MFNANIQNSRKIDATEVNTQKLTVNGTDINTLIDNANPTDLILDSLTVNNTITLNGEDIVTTINNSTNGILNDDQMNAKNIDNVLYSFGSNPNYTPKNMADVFNLNSYIISPSWFTISSHIYNGDTWINPTIRYYFSMDK